MIERYRHTGLVVRDMQKSLTFYEALGFQVWKREMETGKFIDTVVGIDNVRVETAKLKGRDGSMLELLQYHSHPEEKVHRLASSNQLGCSHVAFTVFDIEHLCSSIESFGGNVVNPPMVSENGTVKVAYCHDIDGILMELVEEIK